MFDFDFESNSKNRTRTLCDNKGVMLTINKGNGSSVLLRVAIYPDVLAKIGWEMGDAIRVAYDARQKIVGIARCAKDVGYAINPNCKREKYKKGQTLATSVPVPENLPIKKGDVINDSSPIIFGEVLCVRAEIM